MSVPGMAMQVVARSSKLWSEDADKAALCERTTFVEGNFFKSGALFVVCLVQKGTICALPACQKLAARWLKHAVLHGSFLRTLVYACSAANMSVVGIKG